MRKVGRPVQRINHPTLCAALLKSSGLLAQDVVVRELLTNLADHQILNCSIRFCHQVDRPLELDIYPFIEKIKEQVACRPCRFNKKRFHKNLILSPSPQPSLVREEEKQTLCLTGNTQGDENSRLNTDY